MTASPAQISMPDTLLAMSIFLLILAGMFFYQNQLTQAAQTELVRRALDNVASNAAEFIIKNPGTPSNWETLSDQNNVVFFGLAQKDRVLHSSKVVAFINLGNTDYELVRQRLGISPFNYYLQFSGGVNLTSGQLPPANAHISVVRRFVTINGMETTLTLSVYDV